MTVQPQTAVGLLGEIPPAVPAERMLANMRSAIARNLPQVTPCRAHGLTLSIAGGGPSLADTYKDLDGWVCAVNGSLRWLIERGVNPELSYACGITDAGDHIADMIEADPRVRYYVASICDPSVFDKLKDCDVRIWHTSPDSTDDPDGVKKILDEAYQARWRSIGGGCTMGLRWIDLGYFLGFRRFKLHGMDSSFRAGATHAYPDRADTRGYHFEFAGRMTRPNFLAQVRDFFRTIEKFNRPECDDIQIAMYGDGLLQDEWRRLHSLPDKHEIRANALLSRLPSGVVRGAEIGVFSGRMSRALLARPYLELMMVDSWEGNGAAYAADSGDWHATLTQVQQDRYMATALSNTDFAAARRIVSRVRSVAAVKDIPPGSLDFVFLDADHSFEGCVADLSAWWETIKPGGLIGGHDYDNPEFPLFGVKAAVDAFVADLGLDLELDNDFTWFVRKDGRRTYGYGPRSEGNGSERAVANSPSEGPAANQILDANVDLGVGRGSFAARLADGPTVACVKTGTKYGAEYVTRLRDGVARHLAVPHEFICFTDDPVSGVQCSPLPADLPGWWAKIGLFKLKRPLIYFDLDVVITGDLSPLLGWQGFGIINDYWWPGFNSSVMKLTGNEYHVWQAFERAPYDAMKSCPGGDQQFVTRHMPDARTFPPEYFPSYKVNRCQDAVPAGAMAVIFHGQPKPSQLGGWVAKAWRGEDSQQPRGQDGKELERAILP